MQKQSGKDDSGGKNPAPKNSGGGHRNIVEFAPLLLFFGVNYFTRDILLATAALVVATILAIGYSYHATRRIPPILAFGAATVVLFGALTIVFDDPIFIKIKPTVMSLIIAGGMGIALLLGRNPMRALMGAAMGYVMPAHIWRRLNLLWIAMFCTIAAANEWAWRNLATDDWVTFKTFGLTAISLGYGVITAILLLRHGTLPARPGGDKSGDSAQ